MANHSYSRTIARALFSALILLLCSRPAMLAQTPGPADLRPTTLSQDSRGERTSQLPVPLQLYDGAVKPPAKLMFETTSAEPLKSVDPPAPIIEYRPIRKIVQPATPLPAMFTDPRMPSQTVQTSFTIGKPRSDLPAPTGAASVGADRRGKLWFWDHAVTLASWRADTFHRLEGCWEDNVRCCRQFSTGIYECLCCPDPCYQPHWEPLADTAFDAATVRPITQQRLRWDLGMNVVFPDRSEFFWARADGKGRGPTPAPGLLLASDSVRYQNLSYYFEAAIEKFALIVQVPYLMVDPSQMPQQTGIGDIKFGGKSVIFDCDLLQIGAQFLVYAPTGDASSGLGTGHFSLEPSLLVGLRVGPATYFQGQLSEWIPVNGDSLYAGPVLHSHAALNHEWCEVRPNCPLIGTAAFNAWTFQGGAYTDPVLGTNQRSAGFTYMSAGPGVRLFICNHIDLGFNFNIALTSPHFAETLYTAEFRWRF